MNKLEKLTKHPVLKLIYVLGKVIIWISLIPILYTVLFVNEVGGIETLGFTLYCVGSIMYLPIDIYVDSIKTKEKRGINE